MAVNTPINHTAVDFHGLNSLRSEAVKTQGDNETLRQVASQFESLFLNMMLKSMRDASLGEGIFDSDQTETYREIADQQMAMDMAGKGGMGLTDMIVRQLGGDPEMTGTPKGGQTFSADTIETRQFLPKLLEKVRDIAPTDAAEPEEVNQMQSSSEKALPQQFDSPKQFVETLWPMAKNAADRIGVAPEVIVSQAALETGWGKHILSDKQNGSSFNLFNIKADSSWQGDHTEKTVLEYRDGKPMTERSLFRSYEDYQQSFDDYVDFLQTQPRYQQALQHSDNPEQFIEQIHEAGYATDPQYADKIKRIMSGETLTQASLDAGLLTEGGRL